VPWLKTVHLGRQWGEHTARRLINVQTSVSGQEIMAAVLSLRGAATIKTTFRRIKPDPPPRNTTPKTPDLYFSHIFLDILQSAPRQKQIVFVPGIIALQILQPQNTNDKFCHC